MLRILLIFSVFCPGVSRLQAEDDRYFVKLTAYDRLAKPGEVVTIRAKLEHGGFAGINPDMKGYRLRFTCRPQFSRLVETEGDGVASVTARLSLQSQRQVVMTIRFPGSRNHQPAEAEARIFVWNPDRRIVVVDIDHTISDLREFDVLLTDNHHIPALPGAVEALGRLARDYSIVYLSARDEALYNKTKGWLQAKGFPEGPLFTRDFKPWESREAYKRGFIAELMKRFPNVVVGVGDRADDARAYLDNRLKAVIIDRLGTGQYPQAAIIVPSWERAAPLLRIDDPPSRELPRAVEPGETSPRAAASRTTRPARD